MNKFSFLFNKIVLEKKHLLILFVFISAFLHFPSLKGKFLMDDIIFFVRDSAIQEISVKNIKYIFTHSYFSLSNLPTENTNTEQSVKSGYYRPVAHLLYMIEYNLFKENELYYHLLNSLLHGINSFLIFIFISMTFSGIIGVLSGLFYLIHPNFHQAVDYCTGMVDLASVFFAMCGIIVLSKYLLSSSSIKISFFSFTKNELFSKIKGLFLIFSSLFLFILANLTKEISILAPFLVLVLFANKIIKIDFKNIFVIFIHFIPVLILLKCRSYYLGISDFSSSSLFQNTEYYYGALKALFLSISNYLYPDSTRIFLQFLSLNSPFTLKMYGGLLFVLLTVLLSFRNRYLFSAGMIFFFTWFPVSNLIPINKASKDFEIYYSDHFFYFPGLAISLILAIFAIHQFKNRKFLNILKLMFVSLIFIFYSYRTISNSKIWTNPIKLNEFILKNDPINMNALADLGMQYFIKKDYSKALGYFKTIDDIYTKHNIIADSVSQNLNNLAYCHYKLGQTKIAKEKFIKAIEIFNGNFLAYTGLGDIYLEENNIDSAIEQYKIALSINPEYPPAKNQYEKILKLKKLK